MLVQPFSGFEISTLLWNIFEIQNLNVHIFSFQILLIAKYGYRLEKKVENF
jgi:hypothetical protein